MKPKLRTINPARRFKKGYILLKILHYAEKLSEGFYGSWIKEELAKRDYTISDGTLYPWLNRMEFSGYLKVQKKNVNGKIRKYYTITEKGQAQLQEIKNYLKELYNDLFGKK